MVADLTDTLMQQSGEYQKIQSLPISQGTVQPDARCDAENTAALPRSRLPHIGPPHKNDLELIKHTSFAYPLETQSARPTSHPHHDLL